MGHLEGSGSREAIYKGLFRYSQKMISTIIFLTSDSCFQNGVDWSSAGTGSGDWASPWSFSAIL